MDKSHHHHHLSFSTVLAAAIVGAALFMAGSGYFQRAFHKDILASVNQSDVLGASDMIPEAPAAGVPGGTAAATVR